MDNHYNGWKNKSTWSVNQWINNDYQTKKLLTSTDVSTPLKAKQFVETQIPIDVLKTIFRDIGKESLSDVDWEELSSDWTDEEE